MNKQEMMALKRGDEVAWEHRGRWHITTVDRVMTSQIATADGKRWSCKTSNCIGWSGGGWNAPFLTHATPDRKRAVAEAEEGDRLRSIVYVDMDGVLTRWIEGVARLFRVDPAVLHAAQEQGRDVCDALGITREMLRDEVDALGSLFWVMLDAYDDGLSQWSSLAARDDVKVRVLTSPGSFRWAASAKMEWCREALGPDVRPIITAEKHLLARPGDLLVDDSATNCDRWRERGGAAVWMPARRDDDRLVAWSQVHHRIGINVGRLP